MKKTLLKNGGSRVSEDRLRQFNEQMGRYMPPRETWTPADESWQPADLFRVPVDEAEAMQLKAIKYTFTHHYDKNRFYRKYL